MKGFVHVFTGNGKGKTTAALGMAMRAAGAGKKAFIGQFIKGQPYSEHQILEKLGINYKLFGLDCFIINKPTKKDKAAAQGGFEEMKKIIASGNYDMVILDEIHIATYYKLISVEDLKQLILSRPIKVELVLTGRYADPEIIEIADLVTEMKEVKHYFQKDVQARKGIEY
jgi:cob(I)alamin adenosyltransferase